MTDSWGDGWNGNILGIKQNGTIIGTFGRIKRKRKTQAIKFLIIIQIDLVIL